MSKFSQKIKSLLPLKWTILFFLFFVIPISLKASDCQVIFKTTNSSSIIEKEIEDEIRSYLMSNSCYPVLTNSDLKYEIKEIFEESGIVYTLGILLQEENLILTVFSIEKGWFRTTTDMLYMTTDAPPHPELFRDICSSVQAVLPRSLPTYHVLIQKLEDPNSPKEGNLQIWSFYNLVEWIEFIVLTVPTLDGGTDFIVMFPKK